MNSYTVDDLTAKAKIIWDELSVNGEVAVTQSARVNVRAEKLAYIRKKINQKYSETFRKLAD